jgi:hypothetical protein
MMSAIIKIHKLKGICFFRKEPIAAYNKSPISKDCTKSLVISVNENVAIMGRSSSIEYDSYNSNVRITRTIPADKRAGQKAIGRKT